MTSRRLARVLALCVVAVMLLAPLSSAAISRQHAKRSKASPEGTSKDQGVNSDGEGEGDDKDIIAKDSNDVSSSSGAAMSRIKDATPLPPSPNAAAPSGAPTVQRLRDKLPSSVSVGTLPRVGAVLMHVLSEVPTSTSTPPASPSSPSSPSSEAQGEIDAEAADITEEGKAGSNSLNDLARAYWPRHPYPWGSSLAQRSAEILAQMRRDLRLVVDESIVPPALTRLGERGSEEPASFSSSGALLVSPQLLAVSDSQGVPFGCGLRRDLDAHTGSSGDSGGSSQGEMSASGRSSSYFPSSEGVLMHQLDPDLLSRKLSGLCSTLHLDYWTYEWCHRATVSQYHVSVGQRTSKKDPNWSLGKFVGASVEREGGSPSNLSAPISRLTERFEGGQRCDETNGHRSSEVDVVCCRGAEAAETSRLRPVALQRFQKFPPAATSPNAINAMLVDVEEPSICAYRLTVCSDLLCRKAPEVSSRPRPLSEALPGIIETLSKTCTSKQDSWWTYEVCVGKDIRQFHAEPVSEEIGLLDSEADLLTATSSSASPPASASSAAAGSRSPGDSEGAGRQGGASAGASTASKPGPEAAELRGLREKQLSASGGADKGSRKVIATTMKVLSEFSLGKTPLKTVATPATAASAYLNDTVTVVRRQEGIAVGLRGERLDHGVSALRMEFLGGSPCDLRNNASRASTLEMFCGLPWGYRNFEVAEVIEDSTCHYLIKVSVPSLCQVEGFVPRPKKTIELDCLSLQDATLTEVEPSPAGSELVPELAFASNPEADAKDAREEAGADGTEKEAVGRGEVAEEEEGTPLEDSAALRAVAVDSLTGESQDSGEPKPDAATPQKPPPDSSAPRMEVLERARDRIRKERETRRHEGMHYQEQGNGGLV